MDGKARLVRENFCDGFGDCLPNCPTGAISFEEREAPAYDEAAVKAARQEGKNEEKEKIMQTAEPAKRKGAMTAITAQLTAGADHPAGGLQRAAENALKASGKFIPWQDVTISTDGRILD